MYDTVIFSVPTGDKEHFQIYEGAPSTFPHFSTYTGEINGYKFRLGCATVRAIGEHVNVEVSLPNYAQKHNIYTLEPQEIEKSVQSIAKALKIESTLKKGRVSRVDVGACYEMEQEAGRYIDLLRLYRGKEPRMVQGSTRYFGGGRVEHVYYDKTEEYLLKKHEYAHLCKGKNLLRYETRFKRNISPAGKSIDLEELWGCNTMKSFIERHVKAYKSVNKVNHKYGVKVSELTDKVEEHWGKYLEKLR